MPWPGILNRLWHQLNVTKFSFERRVCSSATLPRGFTCVRGLVLCSAELSARVACAELFVRLLQGPQGYGFAVRTWAQMQLFGKKMKEFFTGC